MGVPPQRSRPFPPVVFHRMRHLSLFSFAVALMVTLPTLGHAADPPTLGQTAAPPSFGREVRPILAKHCFTCHGPDGDAREADLRLDIAAEDARDLLQPGDADSSEVFARVTSDDESMRMPPADSHPPLSAKEIDILKRWINSGAEYQTHWAFLPPRSPAIPNLVADDWCRGPIDRFVANRLASAKLEPAKPANKTQLIRRVYMDLVGITPTPEEVDRFVNDDHPMAYRRLVDQLLASPEYAERFARPWLDLARYADTNGYEKDRPRTIWPYRDWVIRALASDMPFDQFSIHQLAGDMLRDATAASRIATGFHRNTMINEEGGIDPNEYRFYAMVDRVATTGTVWLGLTTGCAQCHTHKYDPITHTDYYALFALLNNADEPDVVVPDPVAEQTQRELEQKIENEVDRLASRLPKTLDDARTNSDDPLHQAFAKWIDEQARLIRVWNTLRPSEMTSTMPKLTLLDDDSILASGDVTKRDVFKLSFDVDAQEPLSALRLEALPHDSLPAGGPGMAFYEGRRGDFFLSELVIRVDGELIQLEHPSHSYGKISVGSGKADAANVIDGEGSTGWSTSDKEGQASRLVVNFAEPIAGKHTVEVELLFERHFAAALGHFRIAVTAGEPTTAMKLPQELDEQINAVAKTGADPIASDDIFEGLRRHFVQTSPKFKSERKPIEAFKKQIPKPVRTLGLQQRDPADHRVTRRHHRGEYLKAKEVVAAAVPAVFPPIDASLPSDRLSLAKWLVSDRNPLVARVTANRAWREFFGSGIVRTAGDFGTQSEPPSHPELLDWLAVDLRKHGWSLKRLHRQIVLSSVYQQSIGRPSGGQHAISSGAEIDPANRLLSRFPHRRYDAERIRDALLSASEMLTRKVGGASVYPPQPASVTQLAYGSPKWQVSQGADRYRRSLYTFSKRTAPFAAFTTFDGPTGELCIARRDRSTTPLQALTLMNDAMYIEIAHGMAESVLRHCDADASPKTIATRMFRQVLVRTPSAEELDPIVAFYHQHQDHKNPWMLVARALMNTDEAITTP